MTAQPKTTATGPAEFFTQERIIMNSTHAVQVVDHRGTATFKATSFVVTADGHLEVFDGNIVCAKYAQGCWASACYTDRLVSRQYATGEEK